MALSLVLKCFEDFDAFEDLMLLLSLFSFIKSVRKVLV